MSEEICSALLAVAYTLGMIWILFREEINRGRKQ